jgi:hypothetical protein
MAIYVCLSLIRISLTSYRNETKCKAQLRMFAFQQSLSEEKQSISFLFKSIQTNMP